MLMLKEGWDVRNVTTIVGLRAYVAESNILPEQTLGRGLRRMYTDLARIPSARGPRRTRPSTEDETIETVVRRCHRSRGERPALRFCVRGSGRI